MLGGGGGGEAVFQYVHTELEDEFVASQGNHVNIWSLEKLWNA